MTAPPEPDVRRHLPAAQRGEPEAIDAWYRAEHPRVYRLCAGFLADAVEAEDAAQDAMLKLLDSLADFDLRRDWRAWSNTLALNVCRDRLRRVASRARAESAAAGPLHAPTTLPAPDAAAHGGEVRALLMAALARLSPREREAFVLHDLQGEETASTARALGISESSVRSLLTLARRRLRTLLAPHLPEYAGAPGGAP